MNGCFSELKRFQVKPEKLAEFEALAAIMAQAQRSQPGCTGVRYMKRFFTIDGVEPGNPPRALTKIVKCVKYFSCWEFDTIENYGKAIQWFFAAYGKAVEKLLIMPFDIDCGYSLD